MTTTQTREPARTPADAQSAGSRQSLAAVIEVLSMVALAAVATVAGVLATNDHPAAGLLVLCLFPFLTGPSRRDRRGGGR